MPKLPLVRAHVKAAEVATEAEAKGYETLTEPQKGNWYRVTAVKRTTSGYVIHRYGCFDGYPAERCTHHTDHVFDGELAVIDRIREG